MAGSDDLANWQKGKMLFPLNGRGRWAGLIALRSRLPLNVFFIGKVRFGRDDQRRSSPAPMPYLWRVLALPLMVTTLEEFLTSAADLIQINS